MNAQTRGGIESLGAIDTLEPRLYSVRRTFNSPPRRGADVAFARLIAGLLKDELGKRGEALFEHMRLKVEKLLPLQPFFAAVKGIDLEPGECGLEVVQQQANHARGAFGFDE